MSRETNKSIHDMITLLWTRPFEDYVSSPAFTGFLREHEVCDEWTKFLDLSRDNPALYGSAVEKYAFTRFLEHLHHHFPERFLFLFSALLADFSRGFSGDLPVDGFRRSLLALGYPAEEIDPDLIALKGKQVPGSGQ